MIVTVAVDVMHMMPRKFIRECENFEEVLEIAALRALQHEEWEAEQVAQDKDEQMEA